MRMHLLTAALVARLFAASAYTVEPIDQVMEKLNPPTS